MRRFIFLSLLCLFLLTSCEKRGDSFIREGASENAAAGGISGGGFSALKDGSFYVDIRLEGGSGRATVKSPVMINVEGGKMSAVLVWSSPNYDYMLVDGVRYENETPGEDSTFTIPVKDISQPLDITADTTAMSTPHEIDYVIYWDESDTSDVSDTSVVSLKDAGFDEVDITGLEKTGEKELKYAQRFKIDEYGEDRLIRICGGGNFFLDKGDKETVSLPENVTLIKEEASNVYLASTSAMDLVRAAGAMDKIKLCSTDAEGWYVEEARAAVENGSMRYIGKYRAPDYEALISSGCDLAIENTMIYHEPSVKEKIEELGIPVMVEMSSYEPHPLGRLEWIKLYGVLFDRETEADSFFEEQMAVTEEVCGKESTGHIVAFFHVTGSGMINVRKPGDYISSMIELSGGEYFLKSQASDTSAIMSAMNMQPEDFYLKAKDADILIYNSTIGGEISSLSELTAMNPLFSEFKAVKEKRVYCTSRNFFQQTTGEAQFMKDLYTIFSGSGEDTVYIRRLR